MVIGTKCGTIHLYKLDEGAHLSEVYNVHVDDFIPRHISFRNFGHGPENWLIYIHGVSGTM